MWVDGGEARQSTSGERHFDPGDPDADDLRRALEDPDDGERRRAASRLLGRYRDHVYQWCRRYAGDHDSALDLAQEVMLSAYRNLHRFQPRARFSTWLFVVARNRCISEMRKKPAREVLGLDLDLIPAGDDDPETVLESEEGRRRLIELIRRHLDEREQEALYLRCFERMPVESITEVLEIPEASGARGLLQRARRKLRAALAGES